jgi:hypothetical protein
VRLIDPATGRVAAEDRDYGGASYGAAFDRAGRLATTSYDGKVRLYGPGLRLLKAAPRRAASGRSGSPSRPTAPGSRSATTTPPRSTCSTRRRWAAVRGRHGRDG